MPIAAGTTYEAEVDHGDLEQSRHQKQVAEPSAMPEAQGE